MTGGSIGLNSDLDDGSRCSTNGIPGKLAVGKERRFIWCACALNQKISNLFSNPRTYWNVGQRVVGHRKELQNAEDKTEQHFAFVCGNEGEGEKCEHGQGGQVPGLVEHLLQLFYGSHQEESTADGHHVAWWERERERKL